MMCPPKKILVAGGDLRQLFAAASLANAGFDVTLAGFSPALLPDFAHFPENIAIWSGQFPRPQSVDVLLLPIRMQPELGSIPAPFLESEALPLDALLACLKPHGWIFGGQNAAKQFPPVYHYSNYMEWETLTQANAVLTAEGALLQAVQYTKQCLWERPVLVIGSGRIATALALRLHALGAAVTVAARNPVKRMQFRSFGLSVQPLPLVPELLRSFFVIFNTVPAPVLWRTHLEQIPKTGMILDLASAPYGISDITPDDIPCFYVCASGIPAFARR